MVQFTIVPSGSARIQPDEGFARILRSPAMARQPVSASRPAQQRRVAGRQSGDGKLNEVDQLMGERRNWQLLPFIIIAGLLVGWVSGQLVSLIPPQDGPTAEWPKMSPR
jgi:hypothetical protein